VSEEWKMGRSYIGLLVDEAGVVVSSWGRIPNLE